MNTTSYLLSKSSFLKLEQCQKAFFLYKKHPYLRDKLSVDKQLTFKRGHEVGSFAQQLFPGGVDASLQTKNVIESFKITQEHIEKKTETIYEATFIYNGVLIMVDILHFDGNSYKAYEVKSSLKVSEIYLRDACLQYYVLKNCLQEFDDLFLVTMNGEYILNGTIEPKLLFKKRSVKKEAENNLPYFDKKIEEANEVIEKNAIPNNAIGKHCFKPYQCDFFGACWKDKVNEKSIFNLPLISKEKLFEWHDVGFKSIDDLTDAIIESEQGIKLKNAFVSGKPFIDLKKIKNVLKDIKKPIAALDMEVWAPAVPELNGTKPFQQIPFLVCVSDTVSETYFFTEHQTDERKSFAGQLIQLTKSYNTILVYDKTMEVIAIDNLSAIFPEFSSELTILKEKLVDLFEIFKKTDYYDPKFKNNFTLKSVTEVFNTGVFYEGIQSGLEAMSYFEALRLLESGEEKEKLSKGLVEYCLNDCRATFKVYEYLQNL